MKFSVFYTYIVLKNVYSKKEKKIFYNLCLSNLRYIKVFELLNLQITRTLYFYAITSIKI